MSNIVLTFSYLDEASMIKMNSFRPESAASRFINYETTYVLNKLPKFSKQRVRTYARLMSAKPEVPHEAQDFRKFVNVPRGNTRKEMDLRTHNQSLLEVCMKNYVYRVEKSDFDLTMTLIFWLPVIQTRVFNRQNRIQVI
jgi:hypothetical protein